MGFGLKGSKRQDLARTVSPTQLLSSYLGFGLCILLFADNLPFSVKIQGDLPHNVTSCCPQELIARAGLPFSPALM